MCLPTPTEAEGRPWGKAVWTGGLAQLLERKLSHTHGMTFLQWSMRHLSEVRQVLPGGLEVCGVYVVKPEADVRASLGPSLMPLLDDISCGTASGEALIMVLDTNTKKFMCKTAPSNVGSMWKPLSSKMQSSAGSSVRLSTLVPVDMTVAFDTPDAAEVAEVEEHLRASMATWAEAPVLLIAHTEPPASAASAAQSTTPSPRSQYFGSDGDCHVKMGRLLSSTEHGELQFLQQHWGPIEVVLGPPNAAPAAPPHLIHIRCDILAVAHVLREGSLLSAMQCLYDDFVGTLAVRVAAVLERCLAATDASDGSAPAAPMALPLPRRVHFGFGGNSGGSALGTLCDYQAEGETEKDSRARLASVTGLPPEMIGGVVADLSDHTQTHTATQTPPSDSASTGLPVDDGWYGLENEVRAALGEPPKPPVKARRHETKPTSGPPLWPIVRLGLTVVVVVVLHIQVRLHHAGLGQFDARLVGHDEL